MEITRVPISSTSTTLPKSGWRRRDWKKRKMMIVNTYVCIFGFKRTHNIVVSLGVLKKSFFALDFSQSTSSHSGILTSSDVCIYLISVTPGTRRDAEEFVSFQLFIFIYPSHPALPTIIIHLFNIFCQVIISTRISRAHTTNEPQ